jgi:hypothetical protein
MHPRTVSPFVLLRGFVRSLPIALGVPPQSGEGERESGWRLGRGEGLAEVVQDHSENTHCQSLYSELLNKNFATLETTGDRASKERTHQVRSCSAKEHDANRAGALGLSCVQRDSGRGSEKGCYRPLRAAFQRRQRVRACRLIGRH